MIPLKRALLFIFSSMILVSGAALFGLLYYQHHLNQRKGDSRYQIHAIVQARQEGPYLSNRYLSELLGLSSDRPSNLYALSGEEAKRRLSLSPHIRDAEVRRINPSTIYVSYRSREPIALLGERSNTGIDAEGKLFPIRPFLDPQPLPQLFFGEGEAEKELGLRILKELKDHPIQQVDVTQAFALSSGKRQIVLRYDGDWLRLSTEDYLTEVRSYRMLRSQLVGKKVVDLRLPQLAYVRSF